MSSQHAVKLQCLAKGQSDPQSQWQVARDDAWGREFGVSRDGKSARLLVFQDGHDAKGVLANVVNPASPRAATRIRAGSDTFGKTP